MADRKGWEERNLQRYGHVRPAAPWVGRCAVPHPEGSEACSRERGHRGPHIAHDLLRRPKAVWHARRAATARDADAVADPGRRGPGSRRAHPPTPLDPAGLLERVGRRLAWVGGHLEEVFLAILFVAFAWFVVEWAIRMAVGG